VAADRTEPKVLVHTENDTYWAETPTHPGLFASGETLDEIADAVGEAWKLYSQHENAGQPIAERH
jgi:predicted RNase H-like HicB family nuclease